MFYIIGLGLCDEKDITVRGLEAVKGSSRIYLEAYTSILLVNKERLEAFYGKSVILADRELVETGADEILAKAGTEDVSFLVVGDPFGATTHTDLLLRARALRIPTQVIHNASIINAAGASGLQLYNFGQVVSLVFFTDAWKPDSFYDRVKENVGLGCHTLLLLDIKVKEQSEENMARGRKVYEPPRYMSIPTAVRQLLETESKRGEGILDPKRTLAVAIGRVGGVPSGPSQSSAPPTKTKTSDLDLDYDEDQPAHAIDTFVNPLDASRGQTLVAGTLAQLAAQPAETFGPPLHSLVLVGKRLHDLEAEYAAAFAVDEGKWREVAKEVYGCVFD